MKRFYVNGGEVFYVVLTLVLFAVIGWAFTSGYKQEKMDSFKKECTEVQAQVATDAKTKRLTCIKDGNVIAKYGVNSPKAPLVVTK